ncbi:MAG: flagellar assembly protein T N-terminal domain-containing protein [Deltaproteobacteria bacterium]|nr:flagellar assembly protein T N-terminal domain-containing protein [Deltaproteobacteria bacterium]
MANTSPQKITFCKSTIFFLAAIILLIPLWLGAEETVLKRVEATGTASISSNTALSRDAAIADAQRKAVEQAVGTLVASETIVENYQALRDTVYTKTRGYIRSYNLIKESQAQGLYQVTISAEVALGDLKDDLGAMGILHVKSERPRVLFMIAEKNIGHRYYVFWWWGRSEYRGESVDMSAAESALKETFINQGFNVADISGSGQAFEISDALRVEDIGKDGARKVGKDLNAEVVIYGKAVAVEGPRAPGSHVGTYIADITAQAVRVDDGAVLASSKGHGVARHISEVTGGTEAITKASNELGEKLIGQIVARWSGDAQSVTIKLDNIGDYKMVTEFKNTLKTRVRGVQAVYQRKFEGSTAILELESKMTAQNIADEISRLGMPLKVVRTTANTVEIVMEGPLK